MRIWFYRRRSRWQSVTGLEKLLYIMLVGAETAAVPPPTGQQGRHCWGGGTERTERTGGRDGGGDSEGIAVY